MNTSPLGSPAVAGSPDPSPLLTVAQVVRFYVSRTADSCELIKRKLARETAGTCDWSDVAIFLEDARNMLKSARDVCDAAGEIDREDLCDTADMPALQEADPFLPVAAQGEGQDGAS